MNEQAETLLRELAAQLGTTVGNLWEVLVAQAAIAAWTRYVPYLVLGLVVMAAMFHWPIRHLLTVESKARHDPHFNTSMARTAGGFLAIATIFLCGLAVVSDFYWAMTAWLNPDYWALDKILRTIGGGPR